VILQKKIFVRVKFHDPGQILLYILTTFILTILYVYDAFADSMMRNTAPGTPLNDFFRILHQVLDHWILFVYACVRGDLFNHIAVRTGELSRHLTDADTISPMPMLPVLLTLGDWFNATTPLDVHLNGYTHFTQVEIIEQDLHLLQKRHSGARSTDYSAASFLRTLESSDSPSTHVQKVLCSVYYDQCCIREMELQARVHAKRVSPLT